MSRPVSRMALGDRLKTIAVTAVLTSVAWIGVWLSSGGGGGEGLMTIRREAATPTTTASAPQRTPSGNPRTVAGSYVIPVAGVRADQLTDTFNDGREGGSRLHEAIDIMAPTGTPVIAAAGGTVEKLFRSDAGGLTIYIRSPDRRTITYYAHLDAYAPGLAEGQQVRAGQALGTVGYSGNASPAAPHLHFAILETTPQAKWWEPARAINPYPLLAPR